MMSLSVNWYRVILTKLGKQDDGNILKYYAQYEAVPQFYTVAEVDRNKLDVSKIAKAA